MTGEDAVAKAGRKALDLRFNVFGHVDDRAVGDMAVSPGNMFAFRCAGFVEECRLGKQHKRTLRMVSVCDGAFGGGDLCECAAEMDGSCAQAVCCFPGNRFGECVVEFEGSGSGREAEQALLEILFQAVAADCEQLARAYVTEKERIAGEGVERGDGGIGVNASAEFAQDGGESVREGLCTCASHGPANRMRGGCERDSAGGTERGIEWKKRVGGDSGEESACSLVLKK